ncbi:PVC-type heme-binding CxxCH protein [Zavarzinella formosa]|uniref:PVC-type heme-binding CxxCH protein n=1 Tax=Zavarzinella formosa TaxID=360055 RepID=UPI000360DCB3|nr:PVC-type heme-binding CxxCH protein [Zavarzinella formosa]
MRFPIFRSLFVLALAIGQAPAADLIQLKKRDHISIVGNTLADRMQHDGWLETELHRRFPQLDLTIRNLGFSGDELTHRIRSSNFGTPEEWLTKTKTDVVFAFFGYNESFAGQDGLPKFKSDLTEFIRKTTGSKYNGTNNAKLVLFSPIAHENLKDSSLPDGSANNARLKLYTAAMAEVAKSEKVPFVDLFTPTSELYPQVKNPLTINGVHLTAEGNHAVAGMIGNSLFETPDASKTPPEKYLEDIRKAVLDKNFHWFERYRTTDGYSIYGGRADLRFVGGQTNRDVAQREMEVLDVMTENRDKAVWAAAQLKPFKIDDSNTPGFIPVETNKPGPLPGKKHLFLSGEESVQRMKVGKGLQVNLFADEKQFPELVNTVQMQWDSRGRLWVATWASYPHWKPKDPMNDKLVILEDTNGDGKADKLTVFADGLHNPTGFEFANGGVIIAQAPDLIFLKDTNGDDKADVRTRILSGIDSADTHHTSNSFARDPGGALYFQEGTFHHTQVESPWGPTQRCANAGVFRYEPRSQKFDVYVSFGFANPHGHVFDRFGQDIVVDGTGANPYHAALFSGHLDYPNKHGRPPQVYQQRTRPCPGMEYLSGTHFPQEFQGNLLVGNVIGLQGILRYRISPQDSSFKGEELEPIVSSTDPNFRPADIKMGPDGAIYFCDWHNPIIGHMQHNLRDPSRAHEYGRVYRVTHIDRPLQERTKIVGEPIANLVNLLESTDDRVRNLARLELESRDPKEVLAATHAFYDRKDSTPAVRELRGMETLWLHQRLDIPDVGHLKTMLKATDPRIRAAAVRVLCYWRDRVPDVLEELKTLAADEAGNVRLEAVRAASFLTTPEAVEVPLIAQDKPMDVYLEFVIGETMKALDPHVKKALSANKEIAFSTPAGARYFLKTVSTDQLLKMKRTPGLYMELLFRAGVQDNVRKEALAGLAANTKKGELAVLLGAIKTYDQQASQAEGVGYDLVRLLTDRPASELQAFRKELLDLADNAKTPVIRRLAIAALFTADGSPEAMWADGQKSLVALQDTVNAVPMVRDVSLRAAIYPKLVQLLAGLPSGLAAKLPKGKQVNGRYVRIELPGKQRTLTLAEVEVISQGANIARNGKATQSSVSNGGTPDRGIDGKKSGSYGDGGQTHTREGTDNPWWEVDLGAEYPIETINVFNRTEGNLGSRLNNFKLVVLNNGRREVFSKDKNPAPATSVSFTVGTESVDQTIRRAAMLAMTTVRGKEADTFRNLAQFVAKDEDRGAALQAMLRLPIAEFPKDQAKTLLETLTGYIRNLPTTERTSPTALDSLQLADSLASLLPVSEARAVRKELGELGVQVIRVGTLTDQMLYDKDRMVIQAVKPVEFVFENTDIMPHNLVFIQPGSLEEIGNLAEAQGTQPGALERHYVPGSNKILLASKLLQPQSSEKMSFVAPKEPGVYPYVCTYPGHWRRMHGALYVVADLEGYQADPEGYLAKNPLPIKDEYLKFNRPRKEWKLEELAGVADAMKSGRSFATAKQIFTIGSCVSCHKMNGVGQELGPDLTKLDAKLYQPSELLKHMLEPSLKIDAKYKTYTFNLSSGKPVSGMILEETKDKVLVIENPLASNQPKVIAVADIDSRKESLSSIMPKGLLDKLTKEEILDLIAYIMAKGDAKHPLFQGLHDHHGKHDH